MSKQFLFNPDNPKKSFDVYIDKNPNDTIHIKYTTVDDVKIILKVFKAKFSQIENTAFSNDLLRSTNYMEHPIFNN